MIESVTGKSVLPPGEAPAEDEEETEGLDEERVGE